MKKRYIIGAVIAAALVPYLAGREVGERQARQLGRAELTYTTIGDECYTHARLSDGQIQRMYPGQPVRDVVLALENVDCSGELGTIESDMYMEDGSLQHQSVDPYSIVDLGLPGLEKILDDRD